MRIEVKKIELLSPPEWYGRYEIKIAYGLLREDGFEKHATLSKSIFLETDELPFSNIDCAKLLEDLVKQLKELKA